MKYFFCFILSFQFLLISAQEQELGLLKADTSWVKEIITFPIEWVPELTLTGYEDLRFAPGRKDPKHENFWSLAMAWEVQVKQPLSLEQIEQNITYYFDGLMKPNHWATEFPAPLLQLQQDSESQSTFAFKGTLKLFDGFYTGKVIVLNIKGESKFNDGSGTQIIVLRYSPQAFDHSIWQALERITTLE
ncbi:MAG: hypothetical protein ABJM06_07115 [Gilvibacter sp.]